MRRASFFAGAFFPCFLLIACQSFHAAPAKTARKADPPPRDIVKLWEKDIQAFEAQDRAAAPPKGAVLFTGSSMIRIWKTLAKDFPGVPVLNRGFGGCQIEDCTYYADRIIFPYAPKLIVLGAGGNDLHYGKSPERVFEDFKAFAQKVHARLPQTQIVFISLIPRISRWDEREANKAFNTLAQAYARRRPWLTYVEAYDLLSGTDGKLRPELFLKDRLHFNEAGYKLLTARLKPYVKLEAGNTAPAASAKPHDYARWEKDIAGYVSKDVAQGWPGRGAVVFTGSSTVKLWTTLEEDFKGTPVLNRGFGGCQIADCTYYAERIITPHAPRIVVLCAGTNDLNAGKTPRQVYEDFKAFVEKVHGRVPSAKIVFISLNPRISRWHEIDANKKTNRMIQWYCLWHPGVVYADTWDVPLDQDGNARPELFRDDKLHFSRAGYTLLSDRVRPYLAR